MRPATMTWKALLSASDAAVRNAKRVVLDSIDTLFAGIPSEAILRSELRRLFTWLKERELTTVITAERGEKSLSGTASKNMSRTA